MSRPQPGWHDADVAANGSQGSASAPFLRAHGAELHRMAAMLTGRRGDADDLLRHTLTRLRTGALLAGPDAEERARAALTTDFRRRSRTERRRREDLVTGPTGDAADRLASLSPVERAAAVLSLGHGWDAERTARTLRRRTGWVAQLTSGPGTEQLSDALQAAGDRHARSTQEVLELFRDEVEAAPAHDGLAAAGDDESNDGGATYAATAHDTTPPPPDATQRPRLSARTRRAAVAGAAGAALALTAWALTRASDDDTTPDTTTTPPTPGLVASDWHLSDDGEPPSRVGGLRLGDTIEIDYRSASEPIDLSGARSAAAFTAPSASWAILWCDLPAVEDPSLHLPELTLTLPEGAATIPCAGREGIPEVSRPTPFLAPVVDATEVPVSWSGDLPGRGTAVLAVYTETESRLVTREDPGPPPAAEPGAVVIDQDNEDPGLITWDVAASVRPIEIGHDSQVQLWSAAGTPMGAIVDGVTLTDDGDLLRAVGQESGQWWRQQDPQLREGLWAPGIPGRDRTFALPDAVRPPPGETRTVMLMVTAHQVSAPTQPGWQVQVTDARAVDQAALAAPVPFVPEDGSADDPTTPRYAAGYRLEGRWLIPADGYPRTIQTVGDPTELAVVALAADDEPFASAGQNIVGGMLLTSAGATPLTYSWSVVDGLGWTTYWSPRPGSAGRLDEGAQLTLPPLVRSPEVQVLAYAPVDYRDFDFTHAPPAGDARPVTEVDDLEQSGAEVVGTGTVDDDGVVTFPSVEGDRLDSLRVTTQGRGRMRVLLGDQLLTDVDLQHDGWWSSWTLEHVSTDISIGPVTATQLPDLRIVTQGWEDGFTIEALAWP
ncbi:hypothetical protein [Ornithinimicrobium sp. Y1694]|uniref:hypothetical protein n=1 Tax=Ornithinimicrobium sp. Y1694 TaxID=3418590 RepID=UPI003CF29738